MTVRRPADTHASPLGGVTGRGRADADGGSCDLLNYTGALIYASIGGRTTAPTTANYIAVKVQDSDDGTTFADVSGDVLKGVDANGAELVRINSAHATSTFHIGSYVGFKRYIRVQIDFGGTHASGAELAYSACVVGMGRYTPSERDAVG